VSKKSRKDLPLIGLYFGDTPRTDADDDCTESVLSIAKVVLSILFFYILTYAFLRRRIATSRRAERVERVEIELANPRGACVYLYDCDTHKHGTWSAYRDDYATVSNISTGFPIKVGC
jgi:hypothetical protein